MPTSQIHVPGPVAGDDSPAPDAHDGDGALGPLTPDQIQRWAARIADGEGEFPMELLAPDRERLTAEVRRRLRVRLVSLIARAIAQDLHRRERGRTDPANRGGELPGGDDGHGGPAS